ncbi:MAG: hypothetical protein U0528_16165 [Anaerolineae bacterium]|nr:hypothetical protein [Anaerolineae bacterium]
MSDLDYDAIRKRVEKRIQKRQKLIKTVGETIGANLICWTIWLIVMPGSFAWPAIVTIVSVVNLIKEVSEVYFNSNEYFDNMREREYQREIERERERIYQDEYAKPKRGDVTLSDDGELVYDEDEDRKRNVSNLN